MLALSTMKFSSCFFLNNLNNLNRPPHFSSPARAPCAITADAFHPPIGVINALFRLFSYSDPGSMRNLDRFEKSLNNLPPFQIIQIIQG